MIIKIKGNIIEVYDSSESLPMKRYNKLNKYIMIGSEIGNSFEDYDVRTSKALAFLQKGMIKEAQQELNNRRQLVYNAFNEYNPKDKAFAILVKRINNKYYNDVSSSGLDEVLNHLDRIGLSYIKSYDVLMEVKKKSKPNLQLTIQSILKATGMYNYPL